MREEMAADSKYPMTSICYFSVLTMPWLGSAILAALAYLLHLPTMSLDLSSAAPTLCKMEMSLSPERRLIASP